MVSWAHAQGVQSFQIELGEPNQKADIYSVNGRFRDDILE